MTLHNIFSGDGGPVSLESLHWELMVPFQRPAGPINHSGALSGDGLKRNSNVVKHNSCPTDFNLFTTK